jgi:predicted metal-dependent phosphoesterase TrpH
MYGKADTHIHTSYSDGLMTPEAVVEFAANETGLNVIAITDHNTAEGAFVAQAYARRYAPQLEVMIGQEVTTREGDILGLFLTASLPSFETAAEAITAIHAQGGLAIAAHPFSRRVTLNNMKGVGEKIATLPLDGVEVRNGFPANLFSNLWTTWFNRYRGQNLAAMGGTDSHISYTIGCPCTLFPGRTAADLRRAIESRNVRPSGHFWTPFSIARSIPPLLKHRGLTRYEQAFSE